MRLVATYMSENDDELLELSIKSVIDYVDAVYIVYSQTDGDRTKERINQSFTEEQKDRIFIYDKPYPHNEKGADGIQRNEYLKILKEKELGSWCLVLDSDEVVDKFPKNFKNKLELTEHIKDCYSPKMRHLIHSLTHEDVTKPVHYVPCRLFKVTKDLIYPEREHTILSGWKSHIEYKDLVIWHLGSCRDVFFYLKKYKNNLKKSEAHSQDFLRKWYLAHIFDKYPKKEISPIELPQVIKEKFLLEDIEQEIYFQHRRRLEEKHLLDAYTWKDYFNPKSVLMVGDGLGHRTFALNSIGINTKGTDISEYAVKTNPYNFKEDKLKVENVLELKEKGFDLVVAYDILEHIEYKDLSKALANLKEATNKHLLISVPMIGDPNLEADPTHKIKEERKWWEEQVIKAGFKLKSIPESFMFKHQLILGEKK
jgi:2-polyprenyl-3-methyl-5-hydroxy-6-metoxy-1,4-benzoquinol methylase